ncbi:MAG: DUF6962 family protein [Planctomycetales bacterium]
MLEQGVTLTDYGLALECVVCAALLARTKTSRTSLRAAGICFFLFLGVSTAAGGTVHGFFPDENSPPGRFLWNVTLQTLGLAAMSAWLLGAGFFAAGRKGHWLALAAFPQVGLYGANVALVTQEFWITMTIYLPAALLLLSAFGCAWWRTRQPFLLVGGTGLTLTFVAALIQVQKIGIHPEYFNHNALYHVVQAVALAMLSFGTRTLVGTFREEM